MMNKNYTPLDLVLKHHAMHKEKEPVTSLFDQFEMKEAVEHEPEKEVEKYITPRKETIQLTRELKKIGLHPTGVVQFPSYQNIHLPLSDEKIITGLHAPITSSLRWLATFALYLLQKAHLSLKVIHGHVVRVLRR